MKNNFAKLLTLAVLFLTAHALTITGSADDNRHASAQDQHITPSKRLVSKRLTIPRYDTSPDSGRPTKTGEIKITQYTGDIPIENDQDSGLIDEPTLRAILATGGNRMPNINFSTHDVYFHRAEQSGSVINNTSRNIDFKDLQVTGLLYEEEQPKDVSVQSAMFFTREAVTDARICVVVIPRRNKQSSSTVPGNSSISQLSAKTMKPATIDSSKLVPRRDKLQPKKQSYALPPSMQTTLKEKIFNATIPSASPFPTPTPQPSLPDFDREDDLADMVNTLAQLNESGMLDTMLRQYEQLATNGSPSTDDQLDYALLLAAYTMFTKDLNEARSCWQKAVSYLEQAIENMPDEAQAHAILGHLYVCPFAEDTNAHTRAEACFKKALALHPNNATAQRGLDDLALRTSSWTNKHAKFTENLRYLSKATQTGRRYTLIGVKMRNHPAGTAVIADIKVQDLTSKSIMDAVNEMKRVGGKHATGRTTTSMSTLASVVQLTSEVYGGLYSTMLSTDVEASHIGVTLRDKSGTKRQSILMPYKLFERIVNGQHISESTMFGSMTFEDNW